MTCPTLPAYMKPILSLPNMKRVLSNDDFEEDMDYDERWIQASKRSRSCLVSTMKRLTLNSLSPAPIQQETLGLSTKFVLNPESSQLVMYTTISIPKQPQEESKQSQVQPQEPRDQSQDMEIL